MKYAISDIEIGDEIIFNSTHLQSNRDHYWTVILKKDPMVMIELKIPLMMKIGQ